MHYEGKRYVSREQKSDWSKLPVFVIPCSVLNAKTIYGNVFKTNVQKNFFFNICTCKSLYTLNKIPTNIYHLKMRLLLCQHLYWSFWTREVVSFLFCSSLGVLLILFLHICFILMILQFMFVCRGWQIFWYCLLFQNRTLEERVINISASGWDLRKEQHFYNSQSQ